MVQGQQQHVLLRPKPQQGDAHQGADGQIEGLLRLVFGQLAHTARLGIGVQVNQAVLGHVHRVLGRYLPSLAVFAFGEYRAQALVACYQASKGLLQRRLVQRPAQAHGAGQVIGTAARVQLPEKPHALLGIGQCITVRDLHVGGDGELGKVDAFGAQAIQKQMTLVHWQLYETAGKLEGLIGIHLRPSIQLGIERWLGYPYGT